MKIEAGYRLTVKSWENDYDNVRTMTIDGLSEEETRCYVDLALLLSKSSHEAPGYFGNIYNPSHQEIEEFETALINLAARYTNIFEEEEYYVDHCQDMIYDIFGAGDFYTRKCEDISVQYVPHEINLEDVTGKFMTFLRKEIT